MKQLESKFQKKFLNAVKAASRKPKIIGGKPAGPGEFPWMTALVVRGVNPINGQFCGGALVSPQLVVTAAHCPFGMDTDEIDVLLGVNDLSSLKAERIEVNTVIIHDDYDPNTSDNDVALLMLKEPSKQQPIEIIEQDDPGNLTVPGTRTVVTGWGLLREGGQSSDILMEVEVPIVSNNVANEQYGEFNAVVTDNMLAAGFEEGGKDACQGDSGGPLMVRDGNGKLVLAGATSWGIGCARPHLPGIYARISNYTTWIKSHIS